MALAALTRVTGQQAIEINGVLRNTYIMLGLSIAFAAFVSFVAMVMQIGMMNIFVYLIGFFGLSFAVQKTANSVWGLVWSFVFAGFLGLAIAPMLGYYLAVQPGLVVQALGLTAAIFFALSAYTIVRRTDFSWLSSFLMVSMFVLLGIIAMMFFVDMSPFQVIISAFVVVVACALILYQTSAVVLGGERNYIVAANSLFVSFYLLFMNLISLLGIFGGDD